MGEKKHTGDGGNDTIRLHKETKYERKSMPMEQRQYSRISRTGEEGEKKVRGTQGQARLKMVVRKKQVARYLDTFFEKKTTTLGGGEGPKKTRSNQHQQLQGEEIEPAGRKEKPGPLSI